MTTDMQDLIAIHRQKQPDMLECLPDRVERDAELLASRIAIMDLLPHAGTVNAVLEIGPAGGWGMQELGKRYPGATVDGVTLFEEEAAALRASGYRATVADMHRLPEEWAGAFDLVYASNVMEHSPAPIIALREMFRILRPGGWTFTVMPEPAGILHPGCAERFKRMTQIKTHIFCAGVDTMILLLRAAELEFVAYHEVLTTSLGLPCYYNRIFVGRRA